jgi:hypothetical protein
MPCSADRGVVPRPEARSDAPEGLDKQQLRRRWRRRRRRRRRRRGGGGGERQNQRNGDRLRTDDAYVACQQIESVMGRKEVSS